MVFYQFDPLSENSPKKDACLLHAAGKIANTIQPCRNQTYDFDSQKPDFNPGVLEQLQLSADVIQAATSEALLYPWEILSIILPDGISIY